MANRNGLFTERTVETYCFDDEEINQALEEMNRISCETVEHCKKKLFLLKILLVLSCIIFTVLFEYMMFVSLWYRESLFKAVMIFTPVLAGVIGYLAADIIDRTFDLNYGLFHSEYQFAYEKKIIYSFKGVFEGIHSEEKLWRNIIAGEYIWRMRSKRADLAGLEGKEVMLLLTRNFFDDDVDFECVHIKAV